MASSFVCPSASLCLSGLIVVSSSSSRRQRLLCSRRCRRSSCSMASSSSRGRDAAHRAARFSPPDMRRSIRQVRHFARILQSLSFFAAKISKATTSKRKSVWRAARFARLAGSSFYQFVPSSSSSSASSPICPRLLGHTNTCTHEFTSAASSPGQTLAVSVGGIGVGGGQQMQIGRRRRGWK